MRTAAAWLAAVLALQGCASREETRAAALRDEQAAKAAQARGDWAAATEHWRRAASHARSGEAPAPQLAVYLYEYGRAAGVTCQFAYGEEALLEAAQLDAASGGPLHMTKVELARLNLDQGLHAAARHFFEEALPLLEAHGAPRREPIPFAAFLDEYATVLRATNDPAKAAAVTDRVLALRTANPTARPNTQRTPYGKHCPKEK